MKRRGVWGLERGAIARPQHGGRGQSPRKIFEIPVAKSRILMHFACNITESVSLKIFYFWLYLFLASKNASQ